MTDNRDRLRRLMRLYQLSAQDVAKLLNRSERTVYNWCSNHNMPDHMLILLEAALKDVKIPVAQAQGA